MEELTIIRSEKRWLIAFIFLAVFVNFSGLTVPLMEPDAGVYASLSQTMALSNDYLNLFFEGRDWLDKPHFPFWVTAASFEVFGIHNWSYKLPGILFVLLGAAYTYLFARKYYSERIALWAVFILLTAMHIMISNNDVRAEPFLTGLLIASIYHFSQSLNKNFGWHLVGGSLFAACAVMTKGVFTLVPIAGALATQLIITRSWKQLFHLRWLAALLLILLFLAPEIYALWHQFDSRPEKTVFGQKNVSGIRFFFWDSQFGRFANTGPIKGQGDPFFFIHTLLWAFLPWSLLMYASLFFKIREGARRARTGMAEWFALGGSLTGLLVFSFSKFQLPYYSNILFPLLALLSAAYLERVIGRGKKTFSIIQLAIAFLLLSLTVFLLVLYRPPVGFAVIAVWCAALLLFIYLSAKTFTGNRTFYPYLQSGLAALILGLFLNLAFYPDLLRYQSGNTAAIYINERYPGARVARIGIYAPAAEFYLGGHLIPATIESVKTGELKAMGIELLLLTGDELKQLRETKTAFSIIREFDHFHVSMLSLEFVNWKTREATLEKRYLVRLS